MNQPAYLKIVVYVPTTHADQVRQALGQSGCGKIGNYDFCSFSVNGTGRFRPLKGANPFIGESPQNDAESTLEEVEEARIETICPKGILPKVFEAVKKVHPYEEPAIDLFPLWYLEN